MKNVLFLLLLTKLSFGYNVILKESPELPITAINITFKTGSANDPENLKGVARLTASLIREGGVKELGGLPSRNREELEELLFPLAADISVNTTKEQTTFEVTTTSQSAEQVFDLLSQMILAPKFSGSELDRLKAEAKDVLSKGLPLEDQEELGKAALDRALYGDSHPYSTSVFGNLKSVSTIDTDNIETFYKANYTQDRITVAAGGILSPTLKKKLENVFLKLPEKSTSILTIKRPEPLQKPKLTIVTGPFDATGVHIGLVQPYNRSSQDFPAMYLTSMAFGKHRSFVGRLMKVVREIRGLNYGAYAYVEDFPRGGRLMIAPTQASRQVQAFTMWARPTPLNNGCFLLKQFLREFDMLSTQGLTQAEFNLGKSHLNGYIPLLATEISRQIGYAIDSQFYGIKNDFLKELQKANEKLQWKEVNKTISKNLTLGKPNIVVVTKDADAFLKEIKSGHCAIHYQEGITKDKNIVKEDAIIANYPLPFEEAEIKKINSIDLFN